MKVANKMGLDCFTQLSDTVKWTTKASCAYRGVHRRVLEFERRSCTNTSGLRRNLGEVEGETCEDENEEDPSH